MLGLGTPLAGTATIGHTASVALHVSHTPHGQRISKRSPTAAVLDKQPKNISFKFGFLICLHPKLCPKLKKVLKEVNPALIKKEKKKPGKISSSELKKVLKIMKPLVIKIVKKKADKAPCKSCKKAKKDPCKIPPGIVKSGIVAFIACPKPNPFVNF